MVKLKNKKTDQTPAKIEPVSLDDLLFDNENARFAGTRLKATQKDIAKNLWEEMNLDELIISIAVNGYYKQEPLLVVKNDSKYVVVEGNRRLAAVKILLNPDLAKYVGARVSDLPKLRLDLVKELRYLPVIVYNNRNELWSYQSFRHVNGPRSWSAISKAEFVAHLRQKLGISFDDILRSIGDKNRTSIKMYNGLMVLRQGEKITRFTRDDASAARINFSHLYTLIQYPDTRKFLGIDKYDISEPFPGNPVPTSKKKELEEVLLWLFGSKSAKIESIIKSQNPDLRMLDDIIASEEAIAYLRETKNLNAAYEYTEKEDRRLESYIMKAEMNIRKAKSFEDFYKGDVHLAKRVYDIHVISGEMHEKMTKYDK